MTNDDQFISAIDLGEDQIDRLITNLNWKMFISSSVNFNGHFEQSLQECFGWLVAKCNHHLSEATFQWILAFAVNEGLVSITTKNELKYRFYSIVQI